MGKSILGSLKKNITTYLIHQLTMADLQNAEGTDQNVRKSASQI